VGRCDRVRFSNPLRQHGRRAEGLYRFTGGLWFQGKLNGKVGSAFGSSSARHGGNESTLLSLYNPMAHLGLIIVPTGYADPAMFKAGTPYGASSVSQNKALPPTIEDLEVARSQGRRVALIAKALKGAATSALAA
jgi:NAD(P)H dehydrogenase (quinone)